MTKLRVRLVARVALACLVLIPSAALADSYTYTTVIAGSAFTTYLGGINNYGQVAGYDQQGAGYFPNLFVYSGGTFNGFASPQGNTSVAFAYGINDSGQVAGFSFTSDQGFLYSGGTNGTYTALNPPSSKNSLAYGINDSGQVVGAYSTNGANSLGYVYSGGTNGTFTTLEDPSGSGTQTQEFQTQAFGINNSGQVVGFFGGTDSRSHGFLYSAGTYTTIDDPLAGPRAGEGTYLTGINDLGQIVGYYTDTNLEDHSFMYSGGIFTPINGPAGAVSVEAEGINNAGLVSGNYSLNGNSYEGFIATPASVPEPASLAMVGAGLTIAGVALARRNRLRTTRA